MVSPLETEKTLYINQESNLARTGLLGYYDPLNMSDMYSTSLSALDYVSKYLPFSSASASYPNGINITTFNLEIQQTEQDIFELIGDSLIAYWPLDETSGSIMNEGKYGYDGTYSGTYYLNEDGIGDGEGAVNFNKTGDGDAYNASLSPIYNGERGSFGTWATSNSGSYYNSGSTFILGFFGNTSTMYNQVLIGGSYLAMINRCGGSDIPSTLSKGPITTRWVHVVGTWDKSINKVEIYINGSKQRPATATMGAWSGSLASGYTMIGNRAPIIGDAKWSGKMGRAFLTNEPLTSAQYFELSKSIGQVVFDGDSRTALKYWTTAAVDSAFPSGIFAFGHHGVSNQASGGQTSGGMITSAPANVDTLLQPNERNIIVAWAGVNDWASLSASQIYTNLSNYCLARRAAGWNYILLCTEIDAQGAVSSTWHNTTYPDLNTMLRAGYTAFADHLIDLGADARFQNALDTTYYAADAVHLVQGGELAAASIAYPVLALI